ncbi:unnamed protein product [Closterium sp. Naga37s-1]|nr:unnamed protein product [Closterium sp. Naga37s-1]
MSNGLILAGSPYKSCSRDSRSSDGVGADVSSRSSSTSASPAIKSTIPPANASISSSFLDTSPPATRSDTPPPSRSFLSLLPFASLGSKRQQQQQQQQPASPAGVSAVGGSLLELLDEGWFSSNVAAWPHDSDLTTIQEAVNETEDADNGDALPGVPETGRVACAHVDLNAPSSASHFREGAGGAAAECACASADDRTSGGASAMSEPSGCSRSGSPEPDPEGSFGKYRRRRCRTGSKRRPKRSSSLDAARMSRRVSMPPHPPLPTDEEQRDSIETRSSDGDCYERIASPYASSGRGTYAERRGSGGEHFSAFHPSPPFHWSARGPGAGEAENGAGGGSCGSRSAGKPRYLRTRSVSDYDAAEYERNSSLRQGAYEADAEAEGGDGLPLTPSARARSLTEADVEELRGFMDLGFNFRQADMSARMTATLPALRLYHAVGSVQQRLISRHHHPAAPATAAAATDDVHGAASGATGGAAAGGADGSVAVGVGSGTSSPRISCSPRDPFIVARSAEPHAMQRGSSMPSSPRHIPSLISTSTTCARSHSHGHSPEHEQQGQRGVSGSLDGEWSFANPQDPPSDVKTHLRLWAQAVASTVRQTC